MLVMPWRLLQLARHLELDFAAIASGLATFGGAKRRFEHRGEANGITFIDDYAHHPSEIRATLAAARAKLSSDKYSRVVAVFQPHRYSRASTFLDEFAQSFNDADLVVVTDIYSAGEKNTYGLGRKRCGKCGWQLPPTSSFSLRFGLSASPIKRIA